MSFIRMLVLFFIYISNTLAAPVSLDIPTIPLDDAIRLLAKYAKLNVVVSADVRGSTALQVQQTEVMQIFDALMIAHDLTKLSVGNVWYVAPRAVMTRHLQDQATLHAEIESAANLASQTWKIRFAKASDIATMIESEGGTLASERGQIRVDARTNIIFARDTSARLAVINQLIQRLDVRVPQVLIEARLVSIDQDAELQLGFDFTTKPADGESNGLNLPNTMHQAGKYSIAVAHLPDGSLLDIKLAALEQQGRAELISSPSLFTGNYQEASIEAGEEVPYQEVSESGGTAVTFKKAVLGLRVTPQLLPGGQVLLALKINQDRPAARMVQGVPTISTRQIVTNVQVKSGQTIVLGGIYEVDHELNQEGLPFLGKIPVIGLLFSQHTKRDRKRELLVFVTPKIMPQAI
jgi:type IV pilus assembly protein PilQ